MLSPWSRGGRRTASGRRLPRRILLVTLTALLCVSGVALAAHPGAGGRHGAHNTVRDNAYGPPPPIIIPVQPPPVTVVVPPTNPGSSGSGGGTHVSKCDKVKGKAKRASCRRLEKALGKCHRLKGKHKRTICAQRARALHHCESVKAGKKHRACVKRAKAIGHRKHHKHHRHKKSRQR